MGGVSGIVLGVMLIIKAMDAYYKKYLHQLLISFAIPLGGIQLFSEIVLKLALLFLIPFHN